MKSQLQPRHLRLNATRQAHPSVVQPVSLRVKLLIGFSIVFSLVFAGAFYWFYTFATEKTMSRLRIEMEQTLEGAVKGVDVEELMALYATGKRNEAGFSDDPRYLRQLAWFQTVHSIEPRAWLYSYAIRPTHSNQILGNAPLKAGDLTAVYLVDLWAAYDPEKAAGFLETAPAGAAAYEVRREKRMIEEPRIYRDKWGNWLSASAPLKDKSGKVVAVLGLDIDASYVLEIQQAIRSRVLLSFIITYGVLFILIYMLSGVLTKHLRELTQSAERIATGDYAVDLPFGKQGGFPDELNVLAQVFEGMVNSIRTREQLIKEGKQIEYEIRLALQQERELNELKSRFVSMVSHELRTPLTVLRTSLELLQRYGHMATDEKKQEYFQRCLSAIQNMNQLLEEVLTIGKAEAGKLNFSPIELNLPQFCQELVDEMQIGTGGSHLILFHTAPSCDRACMDKTLLRSILTNLLSNAIKYSPTGSTVDFTLACSNGTVTFAVQDQGIGIPQADQSRLFELFHRASNVSTIRGTGLGLAIVKQCVTHHNGKITFESAEGCGSKFIVTLPLDSSEHCAASNAPE